MTAGMGEGFGLAAMGSQDPSGRTKTSRAAAAAPCRFDAHGTRFPLRSISKYTDRIEGSKRKSKPEQAVFPELVRARVLSAAKPIGNHSATR